LAVIFHRSSKKLKDIDDIEILTSLPIYAKIPILRKKKGYRIEVFETPESIFTDSFRKLRTNLQLLSQDNISNSKVILMTSLVDGEGKSLSVANLGAILQLAGYKIIVVDLNLHNPTLHKYFDIDFDGGVADYLSGKENMSDIVFSTAYPNLDIIPSGYVPINPSELILSKRVETMFKKLRERYDYVLVDSPSLLSYTDTLHLMKYSDFNLVVINPNLVKKSHIIELNKMIKKYKLTNIGLILNKISLKYIYNIDVK
jgi:capsular exopolysaccharide synthesis family protein